MENEREIPRWIIILIGIIMLTTLIFTKFYELKVVGENNELKFIKKPHNTAAFF